MLGKLMKHEFRATGRIALPLCGVMLALSVLAGVSARALNGQETIGWIGTLGVVSIFLFIMSLFAVGVAVFVTLIQHFKKSMLGDEGYLTMTLPVSLHELLLSRLFTALIWYAAVYVLSFCAIGLMLALSGALQMNAVELQQLTEAMRKALGEIGAGTLLKMLIAMLGGGTFLTLLFYADFSMARAFGKRRALYEIVAFIVILLILRLCGYVSVQYRVAVFGSVMPSGSNLLTWVELAETWLMNAVLYGLTYFFLRRKLNLE